MGTPAVTVVRSAPLLKKGQRSQAIQGGAGTFALPDYTVSDLIDDGYNDPPELVAVANLGNPLIITVPHWPGVDEGYDVVASWNGVDLFGDADATHTVTAAEAADPSSIFTVRVMPSHWASVAEGQDRTFTLNYVAVEYPGGTLEHGKNVIFVSTGWRQAVRTAHWRQLNFLAP